jgi:hypothetical protein
VDGDRHAARHVAQRGVDLVGIEPATAPDRRRASDLLAHLRIAHHRHGRVVDL